MPISLDQYATEYLPSRGLPWPGPPAVRPVKARPHLTPLPVKAVLWTVYGTLVVIPGGELKFEAPIDFMFDAALDKVIQEFKMWQSMSRKPGAPAAYMKELFNAAFLKTRMVGSGAEKYPEVSSEKVWDDIIKKLEQKEYTFDATLYGSPEMFRQKLTYFFHASIQGVGAYPNAVRAIQHVAAAGKMQGLLADGQSFTPAQLNKCLLDQEPAFQPATAFRPGLSIVSANVKARKPSDTIFRAALTALNALGLSPAQCLHVGSSLPRDIGPAKKHGFRTALFAGDKESLDATPDQLQALATRPDVLLTDLDQIADIVNS